MGERIGDIAPGSPSGNFNHTCGRSTEILPRSGEEVSSRGQERSAATLSTSTRNRFCLPSILKPLTERGENHPSEAPWVDAERFGAAMTRLINRSRMPVRPMMVGKNTTTKASNTNPVDNQRTLFETSFCLSLLGGC